VILCNHSSATTSRDFLPWILHLTEDTDRSAELVALPGNAESTLEIWLHRCNTSLSGDGNLEIHLSARVLLSLEESKLIPFQL